MWWWWTCNINNSVASRWRLSIPIYLWRSSHLRRCTVRWRLSIHNSVSITVWGSSRLRQGCGVCMCCCSISAGSRLSLYVCKWSTARGGWSNCSLWCRGINSSVHTNTRSLCSIPTAVVGSTCRLTQDMATTPYYARPTWYGIYVASSPRCCQTRSTANTSTRKWGSISLHTHIHNTYNISPKSPATSMLHNSLTTQKTRIE